MKYKCTIEKPHFIYKIVNKINNKVYVGRTMNPKYRYRRYRYLDKNYNNVSARFRYINRVIHEEGIGNFVFEVIEICDSYIKAKQREDYYITFYNSTNRDNGYNERGGEIDGYAYLNYKKRMSKRMSGNKNPMFGTKLSESSKKTLSKRNSGKKNPFYGRKHSDDAKEKIGASSSERNVGSGNPNAKLNKTDVINIRDKYESGACTYLKELADEYGVTTTTIYNIVRYKTWKNI